MDPPHSFTADGKFAHGLHVLLIPVNKL